MRRILLPLLIAAAAGLGQSGCLTQALLEVGGRAIRKRPTEVRLQPAGIARAARTREGHLHVEVIHRGEELEERTHYVVWATPAPLTANTLSGEDAWPIVRPVPDGQPLPDLVRCDEPWPAEAVPLDPGNRGPTEEEPAAAVRLQGERVLALRIGRDEFQPLARVPTRRRTTGGGTSVPMVILIGLALPFTVALDLAVAALYVAAHVKC